MFAAIPAWLFVGPVGPFRAPGLEGDGLYGQLFAGAVVRGWLTGGHFGWVDTASGPTPYWPVSPMGAAIQAVLPVDAAWALGLVVALGVWLAGYGPWRLVRTWMPTFPVWAGVLAGLVAQTSPVVLRALPGVDLAALALGPVALGLAHPRLAWFGGAWSLPGAVAFGLFGVARRRMAWVLAGVPAFALFLPTSPLPGAMRGGGDAGGATSPAYVTEGGAVFPLPPEEQAPLLAVAELSRTGLWLPSGIDAKVRGNLFRGPLPAPGVPGANAPMVPGPQGASPGAPGAPGAPGEAGGVSAGAEPGVGTVAGKPGVEPAVGPVPGEAPAPTVGKTPGGAPAPDPTEGKIPGGAPAPESTDGKTGGARAPDPTDGKIPGPAPDPTGDRPWIGAVLVPLQRLYGGPAVLIGLLGGLVLSRRCRPVGTASMLGLSFLLFGTLVFGWQAAPGEVENDALAASRLSGVVPAAQLATLPGGGASAWTALIPLAGALGIAGMLALFRGSVPLRVGVGVAFAVFGIPLENPRLVVPVATLAPDPLRETLANLPADKLLLFPAPQWPYLQGQRPVAACLWEAAAAGQPVELRGSDPAAAGLIGAMSALVAAPVDVQAAELVWKGVTTESPVRAARTAGWRYLLVDLEAIAPESRPRLDGWLAERAGMPVARDGARLLYDLAKGPAAMGEGAPQPLPPFGGEGPQAPTGEGPKLPPLGGEGGPPPPTGEGPKLPPLGGEGGPPPPAGEGPELPPLGGKGGPPPPTGEGAGQRGP